VLLDQDHELDRSHEPAPDEDPTLVSDQGSDHDLIPDLAQERDLNTAQDLAPDTDQTLDPSLDSDLVMCLSNIK
jgi:hypothetical protein